LLGAGTFICVERGRYAGPWFPLALARILCGVRQVQGTVTPMTDIITKPKIADEIKVERPRLHKVILVNDDLPPAISSSRF